MKHAASGPWLEAYLRCALRIDRAAREAGLGWFVDSYYGPGSIQASVDREPVSAAATLAGGVQTLADSLADQGFGAGREIFLRGQLGAMAAVSHRLSGTPLRFHREVEACLGEQAQEVPETRLQLALQRYAAALPPGGSLRERFARWERRTTLASLPRERQLDLMQGLLQSLREHTKRLLPLPEGESIAIRTVTGKPWGAANWYLGGYRSRLEINADKPVTLWALPYQLAHEGYPGHHTEFSCKENSLYREQGYLEQSIFFLSPALVTAEGIATVALELLFSPQELADWANENLFAPFGVETGDVDLPLLFEAAATCRPDELAGNAALMLAAGQTAEQVVAYLMRHTVEPEAQWRALVRGLQAPLPRVYALSYYLGKQRVERHLDQAETSLALRSLFQERLAPAVSLELPL